MPDVPYFVAAPGEPSAPIPGAAPLDTSQSTSTATIDAPQPTAAPQFDTTPPAPETPTQPTAAAAPQSGGWAGHMMNGILNALGGDVQYSVDPQSGKMIPTQVPATPGSFAKRVIAGALSGFAAAGQAGPGPGHITRAAAAGVQGGINLAEKTDEQKRAQAGEDYDREQKQILQKAQMAKLNQDMSTAALMDARTKQQMYFDTEKENEGLQKDIDSGDLVDLGTANSMEEIMNKFGKRPDVLEAHAHGEIAPHKVYETTPGPDGTPVTTVKGLRYTMIAEPNQKTHADIPYKEVEYGDDPSKPPTYKDHVIPAGTMTNREARALQTQSKLDMRNANKDYAEQKYQTGELKYHEEEVGVDRIRAQADLSRAQSEAQKTASFQLPTAPDGTVDFNKMSPQQLSIGSLLGRGDAKIMDIAGRASPEQRQAFIALAQAVNPDFTSTEFDNKLKASNAYSPGGEESQQNQSFNQLARHLGDVSANVDKMRNTSIKLVNKPLNKIRDAAGGDTLAATQFPIFAARNEAFTYLKGQHALHENDVDDAKQTLDSSQTPAQIQASVKSMLHTLAQRLDESNNQYFRTFHRNVPDIVSPDTAQILRNNGLGAYVDKWQQKTAADIPFSVSRYRKANPTGDLNVDARAAAQAGHPIVP